MAADSNAQEPPTESSLSKNAIKRQLKRRMWEESREDRNAYKKAKRKQKKEASKASGNPLAKKRKIAVEGQESSDVRVVIDCSFDKLMTDKVVHVTSGPLMLTCVVRRF